VAEGVHLPRTSWTLGRKACRLIGYLVMLVPWLTWLPATALAQTLERIAATKTIRIGYLPDQAPFAMPGPDGKPTGYAIDLCNQVVAKIGQTVPGLSTEYTQVKLADAFTSLAAGQVDLLCSALTITLRRRETVDFSEPIFVTGASALLRSDSPQDLRELFLGEHKISPPRSPSLHPFAVSRVGVRQGSSTEAALRKAIDAGKYSAEIVTYGTHAEGLAALENRDIDAYFADRALLIGLLDRSPDNAVLILGTRLLTRETYGIALRRGDSDLRLLIDRALSAFYRTADFGTLLRKYFGPEAGELEQQIVAQSTIE
jgi:ABC-type amino acid transport substrate-binding protein